MLIFILLILGVKSPILNKKKYLDATPNDKYITLN